MGTKTLCGVPQLRYILIAVAVVITMWILSEIKTLSLLSQYSTVRSIKLHYVLSLCGFDLSMPLGGPDTKLELHKKEPKKLELQKKEPSKLELHKLEPIQKRTLLQI